MGIPGSFVTSIKLFITSFILDKALNFSFIDFLFTFFGLLKPLIIFFLSNFFRISIFNKLLLSIISFPILLNTLLLLLPLKFFVILLLLPSFKLLFMMRLFTLILITLYSLVSFIIGGVFLFCCLI